VGRSLQAPWPGPGAQGGDEGEPRGVVPIAPENVSPDIRDVGPQRGEERGRGARVITSVHNQGLSKQAFSGVGLPAKKNPVGWTL